MRRQTGSQIDWVTHGMAIPRASRAVESDLPVTALSSATDW
jgi:hypothetical protein